MSHNNFRFVCQTDPIKEVHIEPTQFKGQFPLPKSDYLINAKRDAQWAQVPKRRFWNIVTPIPVDLLPKTEDNNLIPHLTCVRGVTSKGQFALRGSYVEKFPPEEKMRITLFPVGDRADPMADSIADPGASPPQGSVPSPPAVYFIESLTDNMVKKVSLPIYHSIDLPATALVIITGPTRGVIGRWMKDTSQPKPLSGKEPFPCKTDELGEEFEREHVHNVYNEIAEHFSHTRYKAWPKIDAFLKQLPSGSIVVDLGCGNGKYAMCNPNVFWIGTDRCLGLLENPLPETVDSERVCSDCLNSGIRDGCADVCLSIAVIHHLSTLERRLAALKEALRIVRPDGRVLLYVWAIEQDVDSIGGRMFDNSDVFVPWSKANVANHQSSAGIIDPDAKRPVDKDDSLLRFYHVFSREDILSLCESVGSMAKLESISFDANNWACLLRRLADRSDCHDQPPDKRLQITF